MTAHGRAVEMLPGARPDGIELGAALLEAKRLGDELGVVVHVDALSLEQLIAFRHHLIPTRPVMRLIDIAPVLVVQTDAQVLPMTHEVDPELWLGSLRQAGLATLARDWLCKGHAEVLADACERTWSELIAAKPYAAYWYDEVAARTRHRSGAFGTNGGYASEYLNRSKL